MICLFPLKVLVQLENEIGDLETQTGRRPRAEQPRQESFSGYTMSLVDSVTKLSRYLKEVCTCTCTYNFYLKDVHVTQTQIFIKNNSKSAYIEPTGIFTREKIVDSMLLI